MITEPKTALVADWLVTYAGAERVMTEILKVFPKSDLFKNFLKLKQNTAIIFHLCL